MAKIKELLANREKLAKYDELTEWKEKFEENLVYIPQKHEMEYVLIDGPLPLPSHIKQIIVSALDAEIAKLDEE